MLIPSSARPVSPKSMLCPRISCSHCAPHRIVRPLPFPPTARYDSARFSVDADIKCFPFLYEGERREKPEQITLAATPLQFTFFNDLLNVSYYRPHAYSYHRNQPEHRYPLYPGIFFHWFIFLCGLYYSLILADIRIERKYVILASWG